MSHSFSTYIKDHVYFQKSDYIDTTPVCPLTGPTQMQKNQYSVICFVLEKYTCILISFKM